MKGGLITEVAAGGASLIIIVGGMFGLSDVVSGTSVAIDSVNASRYGDRLHIQATLSDRPSGDLQASVCVRFNGREVCSPYEPVD
jgi:hypothetical protein